MGIRNVDFVVFIIMCELDWLLIVADSVEVKITTVAL